MQKKLHRKKGDTVVVITGNDKGQKGRVLEVIRKTNRAIVEGVNMIKKHTKPNAESPQGGIIEKEAPVHLAELKFFAQHNGSSLNNSVHGQAENNRNDGAMT